MTHSASLPSKPSSRRPSRWKQLVAGAVVLGAGSLLFASSACVEAEATFYIVTPSPIDPKTRECKAPGMATCSSATVVTGPDGVGDQATCFVVASELIPRAKNDANQIERNRIIFTEVDLEVLDGGGGTVDSFSRAINGYIDPAKPEEQSLVAVPLVVLRTEAAAQFAPGAEMVVGIILKGRTTGGVNVQTPEFYVSLLTTDAAGFALTCPTDADACC
jgi:hypothetical protein